MKADDVLLHMAMGQVDKIWNADSLLTELKNGRVFYNFHEPKPRKDFYPTYKKKPNRQFDFARNPEDLKQASVSSQETCLSLLDKTYRTKYKEPFYKGGTVQDRIPSFCDRLLFRSLESTSGQLVAEYDNGILNCQQGVSFNDCNNYGCIPHNLMGSDHSAIYCGLNLKSPNLCARPPNESDEHGRPLQYFIQIKNVLIVKGNYKFGNNNHHSTNNGSSASLHGSHSSGMMGYNHKPKIKGHYSADNFHNYSNNGGYNYNYNYNNDDESKVASIEWPTKMKFLFPAPFEIDIEEYRAPKSIEARVIYRNDLAAYHSILDQIESESKKRITPVPPYQPPNDSDARKAFQQTMQAVRLVIHLFFFSCFYFIRDSVGFSCTNISNHFFFIEI